MHTDMSTEVDLDLVVVRKDTGRVEGVALLELRDPAGGELPAWTPGAHVDLVLADGLTRQYSLTGDPADRSTWQLGVLREAVGRGGSEHVHERLAEGAVVSVRGPRNHFPLLPAPRYLFLAGGIGITPLVPMVAAAEAAGADWRLVYGGRTRASMAFADELAERYGDKVTLHPQDEQGLLDLPGLLDEPVADRLVYCCGPEPLLLAAEARCAPGTLRVERFAPKEQAEPSSQDAFEVELERSGLVLAVPPDRSVLQVVEDAGVTVLSSCTEGTCGTCETAVLGGEPEHRDSLLTDDERAACDTMMICVSRSRSPRLVLDL